MTENPRLSQNRPLVTFALFAYNQEKYIREAIEGAFAQTYEPLEIILSDDCSSDRTFQIMQEMAEKYDGPHKLVTRRNNTNQGVLMHVSIVGSCSSGEIFVLAAGDDISKPERVNSIVNAFGAGCHASFSSYDLIDGDGNVIGLNKVETGAARSRMPWIRRFSDENFVYGATSAYYTYIIKSLPKPHVKINSEDLPLNFLLQINRMNILKIDESLVSYRKHAESLSIFRNEVDNFNDVLKEESTDRAKAKTMVDIMDYIKRLSKLYIQSDDIEKVVDLRLLDEDIEFYGNKEKWIEMSVYKRMCSIVRSKNSVHTRWYLSRLMGGGVYLLMKYVWNLVRNGRYSISK